MRIASLLAASLAVSSPATLAQGRIAAKDAYAKCPGQDILQKAANISWDKVQSAIKKHEELRAALNAPLPKSPARILWYGVGGDLETTRQSVVAVRRPDGHWHSSGVGDRVIWVEGAKPTILQPLDRELTLEESKRLDGLLDDPCLYASPTFLRDPNIVAGGMVVTLEVDVPGHHWRGSWHVLPTKQEADVITLIGSKTN